jgi:Permuted papain-like amidase enzyme, YaeF/YiiX, C92 family
MSEAYVIHFVHFRDFDRIWYRVDPTGSNKVGYVTRRDTVIHPWLSRGLAETPLTRILRHRHTLFQMAVSSQADVDNIERFFTENARSIELFNSGLAALGAGGIQQNLSFFDNPIRLPVLDPITHEEFEQRWAVFRSIVCSGDVIEAIDTKSLVSRLIARFDHGTWSHVGLYSGNGTILEATSAGVVERDLDVYHNKNYRLGVYRAGKLSTRQAEVMARFGRSQLGKPYNFRGLFRLAAFKTFGLKPTGSPARNVSPNDIARSQRLRLIHIV